MYREILKASINEIIHSDQRCFPPSFVVENKGKREAEVFKKYIITLLGMYNLL